MKHLQMHGKSYMYYAVIAGLLSLWFPERISFFWLFPALVLIYHSERLYGRDFL